MSAETAPATRSLGEFIAADRPTASDLGAARRSWVEARRAVIAGSTTSTGLRLREIAADATGGADVPSMRAWLSAGSILGSGMDDVVEYGSAGAAVWSALDALPGDLDDATRLAAGATGLRLALAVFRAGRYQESVRGFSGTGVFGVLAATAACASALDLDAGRAAAAMAVAASQAEGLSIDAGWSTGILEAASAARDGLNAALLAADGFTGAGDVYEARQGFGEAFFGLAESRLDQLDDQLAAARPLEQELRFKLVPGHIDHQRPVRLLRSLLAEAGSVTSVLLEGVPPTSGGNRFSAPTTAEQALHSVKHALARIVEHGTVSFADLEQPTSAPFERIEVRSSSRWDVRLLDPTFAGWEVTVTTEAGDRITGDPEQVRASADSTDSDSAWDVIGTTLAADPAAELAELKGA